MTTIHCSAILFDLDGVLVDSTRSVERHWRAWAREQGIDGERVMAIAHGVRTIEVIRAVAPHLDAEAEVRKLESREAADRDGVAVMPVPSNWCAQFLKGDGAWLHPELAIWQARGCGSPE